MRSAGVVVKLLGAAVVAGLGTAGGSLLIRFYAGPAGWERAAQIATVVAGVGSAFSALAVLAAVAAVYLQAIALEEQRQELRAAQDDQAKQAATMQRSIELQALSALVVANAAWPMLAEKAKGTVAGDAPYTSALSELNVLIAELYKGLKDQPASSATSTPAESAK